MGNGLRQTCKALMKNGERCKHNARKGQQFCGTKSHQEQEEGTATALVTNDACPASPAPAHAHTKGGGYHPHFTEIIEMCRAERAAPDEKSGMLAQWARIQLDAITRAIEHQRLTDGLGAGVTHVFKVIYPEGEKPRPPTDDETVPEGAVGDGEGKEKVMN